MNYYESDAYNYGTDEAVILYNFRFWIEHNAIKKEKYHDGKFWVYYKQEDLASLFPQYSRRSIQRILNNLESKKAIITGNYNKTQYDQTKWYALTDQDEFLKLMGINRAKYLESSNAPNRALESTKPCNGMHQTVPTIPNNKTTNIKTSDDEEHHQIFKRVIEDFNKLAEKTKRKKLINITESDQESILESSKALNMACIDWSNYFLDIYAIKFLNGEIPASNGQKYTASFSWLIQKENIRKVQSGYYRPKREVQEIDLHKLGKDILPNGQFQISFGPVQTK